MARNKRPYTWTPEALGAFLQDSLPKIATVDPVAEFAVLLIREGVTEDQLNTALKDYPNPNVSNVLINHLQNKFRDIERGLPTESYYGIRTKHKRPSA